MDSINMAINTTMYVWINKTNINVLNIFILQPC
jgi:hypothetical protein